MSWTSYVVIKMFFVSCCAWLVMLAFISSGYLYAGIEDRRFESDRLRAAEEVKAILIANHACADVKDCQKKQLLFASPMDGGFSVDIYLVDDEAIVQKISDVCSRHFFENRNIEAINLAVVGGSKEDELKRSIFKSATIKFKLEYRRSK